MKHYHRNSVTVYAVQTQIYLVTYLLYMKLGYHWEVFVTVQDLVRVVQCL